MPEANVDAAATRATPGRRNAFAAFNRRVCQFDAPLTLRTS